MILGIPNPVSIPNIDQDDVDMMRRGDTVDAFGFHVSARQQQGGSWRWRHDKFAQFVAFVMQLSGVLVRLEPRSVVNQFVPQRLKTGPK